MRWVVCLFASALIWCAPVHDRAWQEHFLKTAAIAQVRPIGVGITHSLRATLEEGSVHHDAQIQLVDIYQAEYRTKSGVEKNFSDSYKYNIAAYLLDKMLDLNMVPVSVRRDYQGKPAAFTWWIDDVLMSERDRREKKLTPPDYEVWNNQFFNVIVFDQLIYNVDRTQENILITKDWKIHMIDHTRSFRTSHELKDPKKLSRCNYQMLEHMRRLDPARVRATLSPYLNPEQIEALMARRDVLVSYFDHAVADRGKDAVLVDLPRQTPRATVP